MKKTLSIVLLVLLVFLAVACQNETHVHAWEETSRKPATCSEEGYIDYTCTVCKDTKKETLDKTSHSHSKNASSIDSDDYPDTPLTCMQNGKYFYRCENCGQVYMETVTAETAEENGVTLQHVSKVKAATADADDYKKFGGYITYLNPEDGTFNSTAFSSAGITDNYKLAKYDSTVTEEKTQFRTKCQTALCASCGKELTGKAQENLKKPVVGETLTVADYKEIYGDWVYTVTAKAAGSPLTTIGDTLTLNLTLSKNASDSNKTDVTLYATFVLDGVTTTEKISCSTVDNGNTFNAETGYRAFVVKLDAASTKDGTNLPSGAYIILSEDSDGEYTLKIDTDGAAATHTPETYAGAGEDPKEEIEWDGNHTTHTLNAMEHYGVKYITSDDLSNSHVHYLECSGCDLAYYPETVATETATAFENNKCKTCGAPKVGTGWIDITIKANSEFTTGDKFMVAANTELKIGYSEYQSFGGKKYQMTGYKTLTNVEGTANGIKVGSTTGAILEFTLKTST